MNLHWAPIMCKTLCLTYGGIKNKKSLAVGKLTIRGWWEGPMYLRKGVTSFFPTGILSGSQVWSKLKCDIGVQKFSYYSDLNHGLWS